MDLLPSQDQLDVAAAAAHFLSKEMPTSGIRERRREPSAVDETAWRGCAELGLFGLALPEELGGAGCGLPEESLLFREIGRRVAPGPFLSAVLGARVAARTGNSFLVSEILTGETLVGLAEGRGAVTLGPERVTGQFDLFDAVDATFVLVVTPEGAGLVETAALCDVQPMACIDPGVRLSLASASDVPVAYWLPAAVEPLHLRGLVLAAAMLVGIAEACRDAAVEHAKTREQFGRPIGVNQAIKHRCADMAIQAEAAMAQMLLAATSVESGRPDAPFQAGVAKVVAGRSALANSAANIQVHGGMGYTHEHDAHLYMKRAEVLEHLLASRVESLARLLAQPAPQ